MILSGGIEFYSQHTYYFIFFMHGKIGDEDISPSCMVNIFWKYNLTRHGLFHIRNTFFFNHIPYAAEILIRDRQPVHQIDKGTVLFFLCCIEISDTCSCSHIFQRLFGFLIKIRRTVSPAVQPLKCLYIQSAVRILIDTVGPDTESPCIMPL